MIGQSHRTAAAAPRGAAAVIAALLAIGVLSGAPRPILAAWSSAASSGHAADSVNGKRTYAAKCVGCHGETGRGDGSRAGMLLKKPADYTDKRVMSKWTDEDLKRAVREGKAPMPAFGSVLTEQQIADVIAYIRTFSR